MSTPGFSICTFLIATQFFAGYALGSDSHYEQEVSAAVIPFLVEGEVVQCVVLAEGNSPKSGRPQFFVRIEKNSETPGGRQFRVFFENDEWVVVERGGRWVKFGRSGPSGVVDLFAQIDIETAASILGFVESQLNKGEYVSSVRVCDKIEQGVNPKGEKYVSGLGEVEGCAAVWIFRETGRPGRVLGINFQGETFLVVQTGTILR